MSDENVVLARVIVTRVMTADSDVVDMVTAEAADGTNLGLR